MGKRRACSPMGRSIASGGDPKGCRGRVESPLLFCRNIYTLLVFSPTTARRECRQTTSGAHGSAGRADCLPRGKPLCFLADYGPKGVQGGNVGKRVPSGHNRQRQTGLPKGNPPCVFPSFPFGNLRSPLEAIERPIGLQALFPRRSRRINPHQRGISSAEVSLCGTRRRHPSS